MSKKSMREMGLYDKPAQAMGDKGQPPNVVRATSTRKKAPPKHGPKTPAPVGKGKKGSPGAVAGQKGAKLSAQESRTRRKVTKP